MGRSRHNENQEDGIRVLVAGASAKQSAKVRNALDAAPQDFVVSPARRLWSARQILGGMPIEAAIVDLELPESEGVDSLVELREQFPEVALLVLGRREEDWEGVLRAAADDFLLPDDLGPDVVGQRVLEAVDRRRATQELGAESSVTQESGPVGARVLVVQDDPWIRRLIKRRLEHSGHRVDVVSTPQAALAWAQQTEGSVDLLVCDLHPPGMDSERLSRHLRKEFPGLGTLLVSGSSEPPELADADTAHFAVLTKPYSLEELDAAVRSIVDKLAAHRLDRVER